MAYRDDILALTPNHLWRFEADANDSVGVLNGTSSGATFGLESCCEDASATMITDSVSDNVALATSADLDGSLDRKVICGWLRLSEIQLPPKSIYREGSTGNQFNFICWAGNSLMLEIVNSGTVIQAFSDQVLNPNRSYHIFGRVEGSAFGNRVQLYIDGINQSVTEPESAQLGATSLGSRDVGEWGEPSNPTALGNSPVALNSPVSGNYNYWASFSGASAQLSNTQIREELFEKGAIPNDVISTDTQANMQTQLDALANSVREDNPLNIRIEAFEGSLTLIADNITHNALASIHIQYMGAGHLTWVNTNGSNASIVSTPSDGTVSVVNPATLTASPLIVGTEIRVYQAGTVNEVAGAENSTTSFSDSINANTVDVVILKEDYVNIKIKNIDMTTGDVSLPVVQHFDTAYENLS
jgi:hypothetical protein